MLTRGDVQRLQRLSAAVERTVTAGHRIGLKTRGRNKRVADETGVTDRTVRRHTRTARTAGVHMPVAVPGRPFRTDYSDSRRGRRRRRGEYRPPLDPWERAARSIARPGDDTAELVRVMRAIHSHWSEHPAMTEREAAAALRLYRNAGGRLGPEAERYWRDEVRRVKVDAAHTPWRAAASPKHVGPFVAHRRELERSDARADQKAARERAYDRDTTMAPADIRQRLKDAEARLRGPP